jgi:hypothetical protein
MNILGGLDTLGDLGTLLGDLGDFDGDLGTLLGDLGDFDGDLGDFDGDLFTENIPAIWARLNRLVLTIFVNIVTYIVNI